MADNIVTRLRNGKLSKCWACSEYMCDGKAGLDCECDNAGACNHPCSCDCHNWPRVVADAVDEIERLRNLGDALAYAIDKLDGFYSLDEDVVLRVESTLDAWKEARRG